jgi:hypothetical protein
MDSPGWLWGFKPKRIQRGQLAQELHASPRKKTSGSKTQKRQKIKIILSVHFGIEIAT